MSMTWLRKSKPTHSCKANWKNSGSSNLNYIMSAG